jgi:hypothetical protein
VVVDEGSGPIDQSEANDRAGLAFLAFGERAQPGAELQLGFDQFYPADESTIRLTMDVFTADLAPRCGADLPLTANVTDGGATVQPVTLAWEYRGPNGIWRPLIVVSDETYALSRSGAVTLSLPADAERHEKQLWIRCRIRHGYYDIEPRLRHVGLNSLPCLQRETVRNELLGRSNGRPNQLFAVAKRPLLVVEDQPPIIVEVEGEAWELVTSFDESGPRSPHVVFDADSGHVMFGNGVNGRVPLPGQTIMAAWYRASGGALGNVAKDLRWKFKTALVPGTTLSNPQPGTGGQNPESLADLELRARALLNRPSRAVTLNDIERIALGTPHVFVARAAAIPNCPTPERITVVAVPKVRPGRKGPPAPPSDAFLEAVDRHLQSSRLLGDDIRVVGPIYIEVRIAARVRLAKGAGALAVIERARQALDRFFDGEDLDVIAERPPRAAAQQAPCPTRWPFGRPVFPSEVYAVLDRVAGVDAVSDLTLSGRRGGAVVTPDGGGAIPVPRIGLVFSGTHNLIVDDRRSAG